MALEDLKNAVAAATTAYNAAVAARDSSYAAAQTAHADLFKCVKGKGAPNNCKDGQPLASDKYPVFGANFNITDCKICNSLSNCQTDCCKEETCRDRGTDYNNRVLQYNLEVSNVASKKSILDTANANLANDPEGAAFIAATAADAEAKARQRTIILWVGIGLVIAAILLFVFRKKIFA